MIVSRRCDLALTVLTMSSTKLWSVSLITLLALVNIEVNQVDHEDGNQVKQDVQINQLKI